MKTLKEVIEKALGKDAYKDMTYKIKNGEKCPYCKSKKDPWFDRTIAVDAKGEEHGPYWVCSDCGEDVDEQPLEEMK